MAKGLICGPHWNLMGPVPHEECNLETATNSSGNGNSEQPTPYPQDLAICIWPRRVHHVLVRHDKPDAEKVVTLVGERWERRDQVLRQEWDALLLSQKQKRFPQVSSFQVLTRNQKSAVTSLLPRIVLLEPVRLSPFDAGDLPLTTALRKASEKVAIPYSHPRF